MMKTFVLPFFGATGLKKWRLCRHQPWRKALAPMGSSENVLQVEQIRISSFLFLRNMNKICFFLVVIDMTLNQTGYLVGFDIVAAVRQLLGVGLCLTS